MIESRLETLNLYVATDGHDSNSGDLLSPFATLERARAAIRERKHEYDGPITVYVREGTYYLESPLTFLHEDSGTSDRPIRYQAYPGEHPVLSGGWKISGQWKPYKDGIYMCCLTSKEPVHFTQLFVNGQRQIRARYPKKGFLNPVEAPINHPHTEFRYDPSTFTRKEWARPEEAVIHIFNKNYWGNLQWQLKGMNRSENTIYLGKGGFQINDVMQGSDATGIDNRSQYYIENIFEELDCPGEWYLNAEQQTVYWMPPSGSDPNLMLIEVPRLKQVIEFKGSQGHPVSHITVSGFRIAHTVSTFLELYEAPSLGDWTIHRAGAVYFEGAEFCTIEHCCLDEVGGNAIFLNQYNRWNRIYGNRIVGAGDSAVCLVGSKAHSIGSQHAYPSENEISNNLIHDIGIFGKQTAGVFISVSKNNVIRHNHIHHVPRAAICINDGTWGGHLIEYNDVHDTVLETGDHGPFNSWGRDRFWCLNQSHGPDSHGAGDVKADAQTPVIIRNNCFVDEKGWGIDLDDGSSNYHIYNNLCLGISIKLREGDYRMVENNIFVNGANPPGIHIGYEHNHDCFVRNIVVMNSKYEQPEVDIDFNKGDSQGALYELIGPPLQGKWVEQMDYNLFYNDIGHFEAIVHHRPLGSRTERYDLDQWRQLGWDQHSLYGDPLFEDSLNGDYRLRPESPAFKLGFKSFDMSKFGLLPDFRW